LIALQIGLDMIAFAWKELVIHLFCGNMQANQAPEADEAD
jgi:hypothetical protein